MKKIMGLLITGLLICALLISCGCQNNRDDDTDEQKTDIFCTDCGTTNVDAADHNCNDETSMIVTDYVAADCAQVGHNWNDATCQYPKTCTECGATEGTALEHNYGPWGEAEKDFFGKWIRIRNCTLCGYEQTEETGDSTSQKSHGSAGYIEGTTVIVSVFASESGTDWDFSTEADRATRDLMLENMGIATSWLERQVSAYGVEADFIYDWEENPDLYYAYDFGQMCLVRKDSGGYWVQEEFLKENIPTEALKQKYKAQNVIYMFYFNTDESNTISSWTLSDRQKVETEIINVFVRNYRSNGFHCISSSGLAHEIMHCFGAYDLYYASETIPQAYVDHCKAMISTDIMYTTSRMDSNIFQEFTRLDAYYLGLVDSCDEVKTWGLGKSTFSN